MHEVDEELREIKREIIESRGLAIKTNNLTNALSADVKSIAKRQQGYERRISWNSAAAYVVFCFVVFVALKFAVDARVEAIEAKYQHLGTDNARLKEDDKTAKEREASRAAAEAEAAKFYELIRTNRRVDIVRGYDTIKQRPLSKTEQTVFAEAVAKAKSEQAAALYEQGLESLKLERWQDAATHLEESLKYDAQSPIVPAVRLALAGAYRKLKRQRDALPLLTELTEQTVDKEVQDDAIYLKGMCQTDLEAWNDAKNTWRNFLRRFPESHFAAEVKLYLAQLAMYH